MVDVDTEHPDQLSTREKETKCGKFSNLKFPITIEPLVCLYTISVGLNEVKRERTEIQINNLFL